jgi:uncharacterized protein YoxC
LQAVEDKNWSVKDPWQSVHQCVEHFDYVISNFTYLILQAVEDKNWSVKDPWQSVHQCVEHFDYVFSNFTYLILQAVEDKYGSVIKINQGLEGKLLQLYSQVDELKCPKQTKGKHVLLLHKGR